MPSRSTTWLPRFPLFFTSHPLELIGEDSFGSCPVREPLSTTQRTTFGSLRGCTVYGYPSSGGVLIKKAEIVDTKFLSLDRLHSSQRSSDVLEENKFCALMRRVGATWWASKEEMIDVHLGERERTDLEKRVLVFGWPSDGIGVWVLRFASTREVPNDFGRVGMAISMDERISVMKEYGAVFYEDADAVEELREGS